MANDFNLRSQKFKESLYALINTSNLPISVVYYIFQITFQELEKNYYSTINSEIMEQPAEEEEIVNKETLRDEGE